MPELERIVDLEAEVELVRTPKDGSIPPLKALRALRGQSGRRLKRSRV